MSSIGMIFKADSQVDTLPVDWVPRPLGTRAFVEQVVSAAMKTAQGDTSTLTIDFENEDACSDPRIISVSGVWGETEMKAIRSICNSLDARFYDAELADFIAL
jgi:predicted alpha/beta-fold hydrolase